MNGHHLILGQMEDFITGDILDDTHDERYRQQLAKLLVEGKKYRKTDIEPRKALTVVAGEKKAIIKVDFVVALGAKTGMLVKYGPGSLVTRRRAALAAARLIAPYQIPIVVVTNGETAEILEGASGTVIAQGLEAIPPRSELADILRKADFAPLAPARQTAEARILYAYEIDDSCPCDTSICRL